ncbi:MAG: fibrobacter succinogenes major paralogous domain-containing protein [Cryomorphaceae bacterium]|nr:fibrobacter succinogenes major paralogous domain-containing protein [Cryomorphaceae bacterium]
MRCLIFGLVLISFFSTCNKIDDSGNYINLNFADISNKPWINQNHTYGKLIDIDGNEYATIKVGHYEWMAENLKTSRFCNGDSIPHEADSIGWSNLSTTAWSHFDNNHQFEFAVGKLYNGFSVLDTRNICPCNWRIPTKEEWEYLINENNGTTKAGSMLKSEVTHSSSADPDWFWQPDNYGADNASGFSALPGGERSHNGEFNWMGMTGNWWSSTEVVSNSLVAIAILHQTNALGIGNLNLGNGFSVRCVRETEK